MDRSIRTVDDVLRLLDGLFPASADQWTAYAAVWWDRFYADRSRSVPFSAKPDENLVSYLDHGLSTPGRIFSDLVEIELRRMRDEPPESLPGQQ